jgi:hypothetical protein
VLLVAKGAPPAGPLSVSVQPGASGASRSQRLKINQPTAVDDVKASAVSPGMPNAHRRRPEATLGTKQHASNTVARTMRTGHSEGMSSRRAQVVRLRHVASAALSHYLLPKGRLVFISHGENTTFRHDSAAGPYLVRVHRAQRHGRNVDSTAAIGSEIAWLRAIRADTDLEVPEAILAVTVHRPSRQPRPVRPGSARCCAGWKGASTRRPPARST